MKNLLLILALFVVGCSEYSSYEECMAKEVSKNKGKNSTIIMSYCGEYKSSRSSRKSKSWTYEKVDRDDWDYEYYVKGRSVYVGVTNNRKKTISAIKQYPYDLDKDGNCPNIDSEYAFKKATIHSTYINLGQTRSVTARGAGGCLKVWALWKRPTRFYEFWK